MTLFGHHINVPLEAARNVQERSIEARQRNPGRKQATNAKSIHWLRCDALDRNISIGNCLHHLQPGVSSRRKERTNKPVQGEPRPPPPWPAARASDTWREFPRTTPFERADAQHRRPPEAGPAPPLGSAQQRQQREPASWRPERRRHRRREAAQQQLLEGKERREWFCFEQRRESGSEEPYDPCKKSEGEGLWRQQHHLARSNGSNAAAITDSLGNVVGRQHDAFTRTLVAHQETA